jgi:drug/metabolite transporter (DMT)-like permease
MLGALLALGCAAAIGCGTVILRRGVLRISSRFMTSISIFTGPPFFLLVVSIAGDISRMGQFSGQSYLFFILSGIVHFALGRNFGTRAVQLIGSTRSQTVIGLSFIVSIILALIVLKETVTIRMVFGIFLALIGPLIIVLKEPMVASNAQAGLTSHGAEIDHRTLYIGYLNGVLAALCWGSSPILIKFGLEHGGSPLVGSFVAYLAASIVIIPSVFLSREHRKEMLTADRKSLRLAVLSGLCANIGQMLRYLALLFTSVIVVSIMAQTIYIWVLLLSFIFNRKVESFSRWVLLGNVLLLIGATLALIP